jgi:phosphate acyltransferase
MRIAVDAMGGDFAPGEIVKGTVEAGRKLSHISKIYLVGDSQSVKRELDKYPDVPEHIEIRHASEVVTMEETPAQAIRRKKDTSIGRAVDMVKSGEADAVVSAGNTGAVVVAATLKLRTLEGVDRPAIATVLPTVDRQIVLIDAGANTDCSAKLLGEFAVMGSVYSRVILGQKDPVVGLMSIGDEDSKGNETTKQAFQIISNSDLNFAGNVEGHDIFEGKTDVIVCDGFVGNVVLKTSESVARAIGHWMKTEFKRNPIRVLGTLFLAGALKSMKRKLDPEMYGGAPLLGVNGICIITHGSSSGRAIFHAIRVACDAVEQKLNEAISKEISQVVNQ